MSAIPSDQLIARIEAHIECWKQFNNFAIAARAKKFRPEDESHFIELKKIIALDAEMIFNAIGDQLSAKGEAAALIGRAPSLRHLSETGRGDWHDIEDAWHKIYIGWHSVLGQIKIKQRGGNTPFFSGKK
jgi:hypothetical protein